MPSAATTSSRSSRRQVIDVAEVARSVAESCRRRHSVTGAPATAARNTSGRRKYRECSEVAAERFQPVIPGRFGQYRRATDRRCREGSI